MKKENDRWGLIKVSPYMHNKVSNSMIFYIKKHINLLISGVYDVPWNFFVGDY